MSQNSSSGERRSFPWLADLVIRGRAIYSMAAGARDTAWGTGDCSAPLAIYASADPAGGLG